MFSVMRQGGSSGIDVSARVGVADSPLQVLLTRLSA